MSVDGFQLPRIKFCCIMEVYHTFSRRYIICALDTHKHHRKPYNSYYGLGPGSDLLSDEDSEREVAGNLEALENAYHEDALEFECDSETESYPAVDDGQHGAQVKRSRFGRGFVDITDSENLADENTCAEDLLPPGSIFIQVGKWSDGSKKWQIKVIDCLHCCLNQLLTLENINVTALLKFQN
jgi:hypothetical protein